jgi:Metal binding domain of Ada
VISRSTASRRLSSVTGAAPDRCIRRWTLLDAAGRPYESTNQGQLGGHRRSRIYGRLDCPAALHAIARGGYVTERVFFADERAAVRAGYRPCAVCLPEAYARWKGTRCYPSARGAEPAPVGAAWSAVGGKDATRELLTDLTSP